MNLPNSLRIKSKVTYEVLFTNEFKDGLTLGEMRPDKKQIVINLNQSETEMAKTFIHEVLHAISDEYKAPLSEKQTQALEKGIYNFLKLNKQLDFNNMFR
jgi:hypothetical protein